MTLPITELLTAKDSDTIKSTVLTAAQAAGLTITDWKEGGTARTVIALFSEALSWLATLVEPAIKGGFLETASGAWLTLLAAQKYGVDRIEATQASCSGTLTLSSGTYTVGPQGLVVAHTTTGKTYRSTNTSSTLVSGSATFTMTAEEAGSDSNAAAGTLTDLVTTIPNATFTNTTAGVGLDAESDSNLRQRCRDAREALSPNGASGAYDFVAKSALRDDGSAVGVTRVTTVEGTGTVAVYVASASGALSGSDLTLVQTEVLSKAEPLGVTASVSNATEVTVDVTYTAFVPTSESTSDAAIQSAVQAALAAYFADAPIGGFTDAASRGIFHELIEGTISCAHEGIFSVNVTVPTAGVTLAQNEVAVLGTVTPTITRVTQ